MAIDLQLPLDTLPQLRARERHEMEAEPDLDLPWAENLVAAAGAVFTVLFVSSVAALMYLA